MTWGVQNWLRMVVPGVLVLAVGWSVLWPTSNPIALFSTFKEGGVLLVLAIVFGGIYKVLGVRDLAYGNILIALNENISNSILSIGGIADRSEARQKNALNIFYNICDSDPTLKERQNPVRLNGTMLTTACDLKIVMIFGAAVNVLAFAVRVNADNQPTMDASIQLVWFFGFIAAIVLSESFLGLLVSRHLALSNDQIQYIEQFHAEQVRTRVNRGM